MFRQFLTLTFIEAAGDFFGIYLAFLAVEEINQYLNERGTSSFKKIFKELTQLIGIAPSLQENEKNLQNILL